MLLLQLVESTLLGTKYIVVYYTTATAWVLESVP